MRISSNLFFQTGLNSINAQQADLVHIYRQVGTGKRMVTPSDDPLAASQAINVSQTLAMAERYAANRKVASMNLGMEENVLNTVTLQLQDVKTRLVEAGNGTLSSADRNVLAEVLELARQNLIDLANSTDGNGQYLFSGSKGDTRPFDDVGNYQGDTRQRLIQVDQTRVLSSSDLGIEIFSRAAPGNVGYVTIPGKANTGTASIVGYDMTNSSGLANGRKVQIEVVANDSADPPNTFTYKVTIPSELGTSLTFTRNEPIPSGTETVTLLKPGDLGLTLSMNGVPEVGDSFEIVPMHWAQYELGTDNNASPALVRSVSNYKGQEIALTFDSTDPAELKFLGPDHNPPAVTDEYPVEDLSVSPPRYSVNVNGVVVVFDELPAANGDTFTISPGPGSQPRDELNMFAALDDVIAALRNPGTTEADNVNLQNAINSALQRIDVTYNNVLSVRSSVGTRMNEVEALNENGATRILEYKKQLSDLEDLDYYSAITQLTLRSTALEAAAMAFQKIQNTSLFNLNARG